MKKEFNTTGTCYPQFHYMMDNTKKFEEIINLIEQGKYFTIHHPRQYGKTTMLYTLTQALNKTEDYYAVALNFQGVDRQWHESDRAFGQMFVEQIKTKLGYSNAYLHRMVSEILDGIEVRSFEEVSMFISRFVIKAGRKLVLLIDEVDASSNYAAFVNFLGMLRNKFLNRVIEPTFYSIVLAGVHDIKNLKFKLRNPEEAQYNSPWNIAVDFEVDLSFNPKEIAPMLKQYSKAEKVEMDILAIAERLHHHTAGYPFLVSKLCKNIAEKVLKRKLESQQKTWTLEDVETSVRLLLKENNTNFDSLFGNLENHRDLYDLTYQIIIHGDEIAFNQYNPTIYKGILYGIFKRNGKIKIHNRIYEQLIYNYLASKKETQTRAGRSSSRQFITENDGLDFQLVLKRFQQFIKEEYSNRDIKFLEREWRLIFLAFIRPIVNGEGYTFKEVQISQEKRLDIVVTYNQYRYIIELKNWYGAVYHQKGLDQLVDYLNIHSLNNGFLVIFDIRKQKTWETKTIKHRGKTIFAIWV